MLMMRAHATIMSATLSDVYSNGFDPLLEHLNYSIYIRKYLAALRNMNSSRNYQNTFGNVEFLRTNTAKFDTKIIMRITDYIDDLIFS